uniref:Uncharacterized protein n=1 Tax=Physcomitrium patens TaxID=3218 RepID=A0A2K1L1B6_PHYPA|nr:hypothetical protein PHYPA_002609 [Physcomitrium patens]
MPNNLWSEAIKTIVFLLNRLPTKALNQDYAARLEEKNHLPLLGQSTESYIPFHLDCHGS